MKILSEEHQPQQHLVNFLVNKYASSSHCFIFSLDTYYYIEYKLNYLVCLTLGWADYLHTFVASNA